MLPAVKVNMSHLLKDDSDLAAQAELITKLKKTKKAPVAAPVLDLSEVVSAIKDLKNFLVQSQFEDDSCENEKEHSGVEMNLHPLQEMDALINLRAFVTLMINNYNRSKSEIADIIPMSTLIDNKIVSMLLSPQFKDYVHFNEAKAALAKARENNDIKSGLRQG